MLCPFFRSGKICVLLARWWFSDRGIDAERKENAVVFRSAVSKSQPHKCYLSSAEDSENDKEVGEVEG